MSKQRPCEKQGKEEIMITEWTIHIEWTARLGENYSEEKNLNNLEEALDIYTKYAKELLKRKVCGEIKDYKILMYQLQGWIEG